VETHRALVPVRIASLVALGLCLAGCAVGRTHTGGIVAGVELGTLPDGAGEAIGAVAASIGGALFGPAGYAAGGALATAVVSIFGLARVQRRRAEAERDAAALRAASDAHDQAWDESARIERERAERERAEREAEYYAGLAAGGSGARTDGAAGGGDGVRGAAV
jgi:hypothetical protein